ESHGSYFLEDLRSRNGTLLNRKRIERRTELNEGDEINVCDVVFSFHLHGAVGDSSSAKSGVRARRSDDGRKSAVTLPRKKGDSEFVPGTEPLEEHSSIVSTISVSSLQHLRLAVKPEAKLRAVLEIGRNLGKTLNLDELLPKLLDSLFKIFPQADRGMVLLRDPETEELELQEIRTRHEEEMDSPPISMTVVRQALETAQAILSEDAVSDGRFKQSDSVANFRIRSLMCAPLLGHDGSVLGILQIDTQDIRYRFSQDDLDLLASVAAQAALAVENAHLHEDALRRRDLERHLEFATQVQLGFLPNERPQIPGYEFYDFYEAALGVGGDFFDYVALPNGKLAVALGDVAGKGVPAALLMARLYSMARYQLLAEPTAARTLTALNAGLASSGLGHRFVTFVAAILDPMLHQATVVNAGHMPPLLVRKTGEVQPVGADVSGLPLGIRLDYEYEQLTLTLEPGDTLVLFTDGVTEAMSPDEEIYGTARLRKFLAKARGSLEEVGEALVADVQAFSGGRSQRDDICLVCVRRKADT
ncbi:MAG TPA: SpoIIE family protein phosphatase, partial [Planctomycetaceae bacterium]|nr:SpoIIE family protein phosphatase [Planctomycetaceae bacterium]